MRRLLSIAMMLVLALPLVAPALGQSAATPVCCMMRGGVHKCLLHAAETSGSPTFRAHCPMQSQQGAPGHATGWMLGEAGVRGIGDAVAELRVGQAEAGWRISFGRSRQKRGPPVESLG